jgi:hypothetical protein
LLNSPAEFGISNRVKLKEAAPPASQRTDRMPLPFGDLDVRARYAEQLAVFRLALDPFGEKIRDLASVGQKAASHRVAALNA